MDKSKIIKRDKNEESYLQKTRRNGKKKKKRREKKRKKKREGRSSWSENQKQNQKRELGDQREKIVSGFVLLHLHPYSIP